MMYGSRDMVYAGWTDGECDIWRWVPHLKIKKNFGNEMFFFETISKKDVLDLIKKIPGNKATLSKSSPFQYSKNLFLSVMNN